MASTQAGEIVMMETVLAVDNDADILELLRYNLERENCRVLSAQCGDEAIQTARKHIPDLVILEPYLNDGDGYEVLTALRNDPRTSLVPVVLLSSRAGISDRIEGLSKNADDYIAKPFSPRELVLRVRALLRRSARTRSFLRNGPFFLDKSALKCYLRGKPLDLTITEFKILSLLLEHPHHTTQRSELMLYVWSQESEAPSRTLDTHMKRLREKLGRYGNTIRTVRNVGYRYSPSSGLNQTIT